MKQEARLLTKMVYDTIKQNRNFQKDLRLCSQIQSHLYIALDQGYIKQEEFSKIYNQADKTAKLISGLIKYLKENEKQWKLNKPKKLDKLE